MRYASIRKMDISNGEGIGIALFVQGCHFHCYNCFNPETWDFKSGKEWNRNTQEQFINLAKKDYISRVSILGGEPLAKENVFDVFDMVHNIKKLTNNKIWLYTGYTFEEIINPISKLNRNVTSRAICIRKEIVNNIDILVDGQYIDELRDITLAWRGSSNQRVIDVKESLRQGNVVLYTQ